MNAGVRSSSDRDSVHPEEPGGAGYRVLYVDMAYTHEIVERKGHQNFFETRHSGGFFERVWGVHPIADVAGSRSRQITTIPFSSHQTIIEGVSRTRNWPAFLAPLDFLLSQATLVRMLLRTIRKERIDLIVATDPFYSGLFGAILKFFSRRKLIVGVYADYDFAHRTFGFIAMPRLFPWYWMQNLVAGLVMRSADLAVGGTHKYLQWAKAHGARDGAVIPIARNIEPCHLASPTLRGDPRPELAELGIPVRDQYLIMVSRLIPVKFAEDGVRAMIRVAQADPEAVAIVAGDGPLRPQLEALTAEHKVSEQIRFVGHVPQERLSAILPRCVTVSPMTGMALVEAGLAGSPAVAYDADWQSEFVIDRVNGFLVPLGDWQTLADRALTLLHDRALREGFSAAMREHAERASDREAIAEKEREIFLTVLDPRADQA